MSEPWEKAMEMLDNHLGGVWLEPLATIRKHIEDQAEELQRANRDCRAELEALAAELTRQSEWSAKQLVDLMDANIYQQRRIEELEKALGRVAAAFDIHDCHDFARAALPSSEPETG